jgi:uncharacterized protein YprB with RNaseH-like and TPR domain
MATEFLPAEGGPSRREEAVPAMRPVPPAAASTVNRLRQVISGVVPRVDTGESPSSAPVPEFSRPEPVLDGARIADMLAGQWVESRDGAVLMVDRFYAADRRHGRSSVGEIVETIEGGLDALRLLGQAWPGRDPRPYTTNLCFFDLETTGLAGGAGTQAFLVGTALIEDGGLRVRQFLLPGFQHERALLARVADWSANAGTLVTFNGRTFDVPLIETRYLLHRVTFPLGEIPHLDMLHPARGLWKQRPTVAGPALDDDSCKLSVLERHLAGYHRIGDVGGWEIPSRYFRFIRTGDVRGLEAVLEHNRIDLISLALVTARAITLITDGPHMAQHPREALGLGRLYERSGAADNAEASFATAASLAARAGVEPDVRAEALRRLAICRRRAGRMADAAAAWQELVSVPGCPSVVRREAREALAIHHEHRSRDLHIARTFVLDVLAEGASTRTRESAEYRLRRIERKLSVREQQMLLE